eukprot:791719-Amphidinium_carterae.1
MQKISRRCLLGATQLASVASPKGAPQLDPRAVIRVLFEDWACRVEARPLWPKEDSLNCLAAVHTFPIVLAGQPQVMRKSYENAV